MKVRAGNDTAMFSHQQVGTAAVAVPGDPLRQTLHTSKRGLIFNYPRGTQVGAPQINVLLGNEPAPAKLNTQSVEPATLLVLREMAISSFLMVS